ncbi:hypothetical protein NDU88_004421 [Pleurodeles waltl]|uniref:Uncharacterized protein n=1 Tax=Pleurodeles waltl TaxID=8319 RepID=A0AAV7TR82_PLEWA|nr:hypothetical protein NDU88_004421 [Pleurodeles waltl]
MVDVPWGLVGGDVGPQVLVLVCRQSGWAGLRWCSAMWPGQAVPSFLLKGGDRVGAPKTRLRPGAGGGRGWKVPPTPEVRSGGLAWCFGCGLPAAAYWGEDRTPRRVASAAVTAAGAGRRHAHWSDL